MVGVEQQRRNDRASSYCTLWLDANVNQGEENLRAQERLRMFVQYLYAFDDQQRCLEYIQSLSSDYQIILIVSGQLGNSIVSEICHLQKVLAIYVYCGDKKRNELWARHYFKVKGVVNQFDDLIDCLRPYQAQKGYRANTEEVLIHISGSSAEQSDRSSTRLNGEFLHSQLFIDCSIRMATSAGGQAELIAACREWCKHDRDELKLIDEFEQSYSADQAICWYTRESFVYRLVNQALRRQNIHQVFLFRSFIRDLGEQLRLCRSQSPVRVYRAQRMYKEEIAALQQSVGQYISMNSFLSTSESEKRSRTFLESNFCSQQYEQVLFEIHADPGAGDGPVFSNISAHSVYPAEQEVIFVIGSIFQIVQMKRDEDNFWRISLVLCSNKEKSLQTLGQHMKEELGTGETSLYSFGHVLGRMGQWDEAERYFQLYLQELPPNDPRAALCYHGMGRVADSRGDDQTSLNYYHKSLEIAMRADKPNLSNVARAHNSIGVVYRKNRNTARALGSFERALAIWEKTSSEDDVNVAMCLNNIGELHADENDYSKALAYYKKALAIWLKRLPPDHPDLGAAFNNIGTIYDSLGQYKVALSNYQLSLEIKRKSLPAKHPDIGMTLRNVGLIFEHQGDRQQAQKYFEQAIDIYGESHSTVQVRQDIRRISLIEQ